MVEKESERKKEELQKPIEEASKSISDITIDLSDVESVVLLRDSHQKHEVELRTFQFRRRVMLFLFSLVTLSIIIGVALLVYFTSSKVGGGDKLGVLLGTTISSLIATLAGYLWGRKRESSIEKDIEAVRSKEKEFYKKLDDSIHSRVSKVS